MVEVRLSRVRGFRFLAENQDGKRAVLDASRSIGGEEDGLRPMELLLMALAGCSSFDVLHILRKARQGVEGLEVRVRGYRADTIPAVYTYIEMHFAAGGEVSLEQLQKACRLSLEKYCSVAAMLKKTAEIIHTCSIDKDLPLRVEEPVQ